VVDIDLLGSFNASHAAFEQLKTTRGNIIFISAGQSFQPYFAQAHVGAAKAGIDNLMKNLAWEWGPYGIRSNSIAPGPIEGTEGMSRLGAGGIMEKLKSIIPLRRYGTIDDIAETAVFLASPLATYITGSCVVVDGGQNLPGSGQLTECLMDLLAAKK
jgi:NAD(P)-dependent dehydrogenase (short-subunit alcohol dehydrogenase family)